MNIFRIKATALVLLSSVAAGAQPSLPPGPKLPDALPLPRSSSLPPSAAPPRISVYQAYRVALELSPRASERLTRYRVPRPAVANVTTGGKKEPVSEPPEEASVALVRQLSRSPLLSNLDDAALNNLLAQSTEVEARLEKSRQRPTAKSQRLVSEWQELCQLVNTAYLESLRAMAHAQLARQFLDDASKSLKDSQERFDAGKVPRGDVLFATVPRSEAEVEYRRALSSFRGKLEQLNAVLGLPTGAALMPIEVRLPEPLTIGPDRCVLEAMALQPEARAVRYEIVSQAFGVAAARKDSSAQVMALASMASLTDAEIAAARNGQSNPVDLSLPTVIGKKGKNDAANATRSPELQLEDLRLKVESEVRDAYRLTELTAQVYNLGLGQLATAQEAKSIASAQYRAGLAPFSQLYAVQLELWKAARNGVDNFYDYLEARSRLDFARGVDPDPPQ